MDRETIKIITPVSKDEIVIKAYLTGREKRALTNVYLENKNLSYDVATEKVAGIDYSIIDKAQDLALRTIIISFNGKQDGIDGFSIVDAVLDLRSQDSDFVIEKINGITADKEFAEKKTS